MDHKPVCRPALFTARLLSAAEVKKTIPFLIRGCLRQSSVSKTDDARSYILLAHRGEKYTRVSGSLRHNENHRRVSRYWKFSSPTREYFSLIRGENMERIIAKRSIV
jgi:hypothetical protein